MLYYITKHKGLLLLEIFAATARAGCDVVLSFAMGYMTNAAVDRQVSTLVWSSVTCAGCLIALYVLYILEITCRKQLSGKCLVAIKADLYSALAARGMAQFHEQTDSYYLNLLQGDMDLLERDYFDTLWRGINLAIQVAFCMAALVAVSIKLFVIFALVSIIPQVTSRLFREPLINTKNAFSNQNSRCIQKGKEFICGFDTILFFSMQKVFISRLLKEDNLLEKRRQERDVCNIKISYGTTTINMVAQIICMAAAAYFVATGELRFGALTTSTQLLNYTFTPLNTVINCALSILSTKGIRSKFRDLISAPQSPKSNIFRDGDICFDHITVSYGERDVLQDFSCRLRQGGTYAIVGNSGSGKSTLVQAIFGSAQVRKGAITIGGVDVRTVEPSDLYRNILYVPQNTFLFEGTVLENISFFGTETLAAENARRAALPEDLLRAQAGGDRGNTMSGGEMTRLSIARALGSDAPILIFDEPTSGLDPNTATEIERLIQDIAGKTVLVITHNWNRNYLDQFDDVIEIGRFSFPQGNNEE